MSDWLDRDYYDVLGVSETATPEEITKAYRRLARRLHPDANPGDKGAEERFKQVSAAYGVIGDSARRAEYDEARRLVTSSAAPGGGPFRVHVTNADDLGEGPRGRGELLVTIEVAVPPKVQGQERKAVEGLAQAISWSPRARLGV